MNVRIHLRPYFLDHQILVILENPAWKLLRQQILEKECSVDMKLGLADY